MKTYRQGVGGREFNRSVSAESSERTDTPPADQRGQGFVRGSSSRHLARRTPARLALKPIPTRLSIVLETLSAVLARFAANRCPVCGMSGKTCLERSK